MQAITATSPLTLGAWQRRPSQTLFQFAPVLRSIWQDDLADLAALHTRYWESDEEESGEILIASIDGHLIGITGWYRS